MDKILKLVTAAAVGAILVGCQQQSEQFPYPHGETTAKGDVVGGVVQSGSGGYRGGPDKSTITGGTLLKGILNSDVGTAMDRQDQMNMQQAVINTPLDEQAEWNNKRRHAKYSVVPLRDYESATGQYCREYEATVDKDGKKEKAYGKACRNSQGKWDMKH